MLTEGGRDIGLGHLTRCISLSQSFEKRGIIPEFIVNSDALPEDLAQGIKYQVFNWLKEQKRLFELIRASDICIIDSYLADLELYKKISGIAKSPVYIDDNKRLDYPAGFVVNGNIYAKELKYPRREDIVYSLGSQYIPLRKEFRDAAKKQIRNNIKSVMVTFGSNDRTNMTPKVLKVLKDKYAGLTKNIIIGRGFQNIKEIEELKDKKTNLIYSPGAKKMKKVMEESDLAVSAGGQTLYELARIGVPAIGVCVAENQRMNLEAWHKTGFLEYIGRHNDKDLMEKLKNSMKRLEDADVRKNKSGIGRKSIDGKGSFRTVDTLLCDYFKNNFSLRMAKADDALAIFNLSNDGIVRNNSFNSEKIEWGSHLKWFKEKLDDKNCVFFVFNSSNRFNGQIRFDIDPNKKEALASISLIKTMRGLGLSSFILNKSIDKLLRIHKDVKSIKAYIKKENTPSIKAFKNAGFKFLKNTIYERIV